MNKTSIKHDYCVIGAGSGGLSLAAGLSQMGADVVLIEANKMGGDCLNSGCVPSKALLKAASFNKELKKAPQFGWKLDNISLDFNKALAHVQNAINSIAPHDSVERFESLGVKVIKGKAVFVSKNQVAVDKNTLISAKRFVIATGSRAFIPPINGLDTVDYHTNESIFHLKKKPDSMAIIGGGPIGMEMAQAFNNLGVRVTVLEAFTALPKDNKILVEKLLKILKADGIQIEENAKISSVSKNGENITINYTDSQNKEKNLTVSSLLVAAGRLANVDGLNLEKAGVRYDKKGIKVKKNMLTSNKKIYAIGDCTGGYQFTHVAGHHASMVIRNSVFKMPVKILNNTIPWVTYTEPELAHVGMTQDELDKKGYDYQIIEMPWEDNNRAVTDAKTTGHIMVATDKGGKILGASILGSQAGELIFPWVMAIQNKLNISAIVSTIAAYPTLSEINKQVAGKFYTPKIYSSKMRRFVKFMGKYFLR